MLTPSLDLRTASLKSFTTNTDMIDIGNLCTHCGDDTSFGSGKFVNRIPSSHSEGIHDEERVGYMCAECQSIDCDSCGEATLDYEFTDDGDVVCYECNQIQTQK